MDGVPAQSWGEYLRVRACHINPVQADVNILSTLWKQTLNEDKDRPSSKITIYEPKTHTTCYWAQANAPWLSHIVGHHDASMMGSNSISGLAFQLWIHITDRTDPTSTQIIQNTIRTQSLRIRCCEDTPGPVPDVLAWRCKNLCIKSSKILSKRRIALRTFEAHQYAMTKFSFGL